MSVTVGNCDQWQDEHQHTSPGPRSSFHPVNSNPSNDICPIYGRVSAQQTAGSSDQLRINPGTAAGKVDEAIIWGQNQNHRVWRHIWETFSGTGSPGRSSHFSNTLQGSPRQKPMRWSEVPPRHLCWHSCAAWLLLSISICPCFSRLTSRAFPRCCTNIVLASCCCSGFTISCLFLLLTGMNTWFLPVIHLSCFQHFT